MKLKSISAFFGLLLVMGCGSGTDPMTILGNPYEIPSLGLPVARTAFSGTSPFQASQDGIAFLPSIGTAVNVVAPAAGTVTDIDTTSIANFASVTIMHNSRYFSRLSYMPTTSLSIPVRKGDTVTAGQTVATVLPASVTLNGVTTNRLVQLTVLYDGVAVCPFSYLSSDARSAINFFCQ